MTQDPSTPLHASHTPAPAPPSAHASRMSQAGARRRVPRHGWAHGLALLASIPAFYAELLGQTLWPALSYVAAALLVTAGSWLDRHDRRDGAASRSLDAVLVALLLASAAAPTSLASNAALALRLAASAILLLRALITFEPLLVRGHLAAALFLAGGVLTLCGVGYWKLEPTVKTLGEGLWLAFVTASTIGYGDIVPTVTASRILSVFVVMLGFGVLSLVTATVAARWVEREERDIEHEILREVHREIAALRRDLHALDDARRRDASEPRHPE
jgi:voltage-gated potassium channel